MSIEANRAQLGFLGWLPHGVLDMICTYIAISDVPLLLLLPPPISSCIDRIASLLDYSELCHPSKSWYLLFWAASVSKLPHTTLVCIFNIVSEMLRHSTPGFSDMLYIAAMWKMRWDEMQKIVRDEKSGVQFFIARIVRINYSGTFCARPNNLRNCVADTIYDVADCLIDSDAYFEKSIVVAIGLERHQIIKQTQAINARWHRPYLCAVMSRNEETIRCVIDLMGRQNQFYDLEDCQLCALEHRRFDDYLTFRNILDKNLSIRDNSCVDLQCT